MIFPFGPQPPRSHFPQRRPPMQMIGRPPMQVQRNTNSQLMNVMSLFQTPEGNLDLEKVTNAFQQMNKIYGHVSPLLSRFLNR